METYFQTLHDYVLAQQPDLGGGETVLEMIYECYSQLNCMDNETIRKNFDELYRAMHSQTLREIDKVIYTVCTLCRDHERSGFLYGVQVGVRLADELK